MDILNLLFRDFVSVEWSACGSSVPSGPGTHVYTLIVEAGTIRFPLYVGQTGRLLGRVGDYQTAQFAAATDFRVGEAIKYLLGSRDCRVHFLYRPTASHLKDEKLLIRELLLSGYTLLNFLGAFDYKGSNQVDERAVIHRFCDMALSQAQFASRQY
jgi:hypothetical protein